MSWARWMRLVHSSDGLEELAKLIESAAKDGDRGSRSKFRYSLLRRSAANHRSQPMRKISSSSTVFYKYVFPVIWFGGCGLLLILAALPAVIQNQAPVFILLPPVGMIVFGYILMRALIFDLVDDVFLNGEEIIVRNFGEVGISLRSATF